MPSLRLGISATAIYAAIIAAATFYFFHRQGAPSDIGGVLLILLPIQLVAAVLCVIVVTRLAGWRAVGFGRFHLSGMMWFLPAWFVLAGMVWDLIPLDLQAFGIIGLVTLIFTTFLIAFGEEVIFRGLLLRGAMTRLSLPMAMLLSTTLFGLFHLINGLAGQGAGQTAQQVLFALLVGFFLAPIAIRLGNLWPLIIWHWVWNIAVILGQTAGVMHPLALAGIAVQAVVSIWLWAAHIRAWRTG
ncbi:hypothetical protein BC777_3234 [Yoonia maricola]|uniref:CAAX prenyl protease 2/Lysostaphin resistance protein A-like domain-containing protein n=1 Tax=Yoonia maricola TaxID=420999 RepID=A0A2M8W2T2_9RHOB|nr:CPBP family intramembrane glutamic endopeptidase [Yoonia maricola]PJI85234.1 hypothetical protein BC777_3234 [Yoonia maricola]